MLGLKWHNKTMTQDVLAQAQAMLPELQTLRRKLHTIPEFGLDLPNTLKVILEQIDGLGTIKTSKQISSAVLHIKGSGPGPTVLLRADMDALAVVEDTGLEYASTNGYMHACGHDLHMAMGVGAAKTNSKAMSLYFFNLVRKATTERILCLSKAITWSQGTSQFVLMAFTYLVHTHLG
jgi:metal-dependent amidase/aminoacylase/carboxypeptidase family protein